MDLVLNGKAYQLKRADEKDLDQVLQLLVQAAKWLKTKGTTQWNYYITNLEGNIEEVRESIISNSTYLLLDKKTVVASITLEEEPNDWDCDIWGEEAHNDCSVYLHRLVVNRDYSGSEIGKQLVDWAKEFVKSIGKRYIRFDCLGDNEGLNVYYQRHYKLKGIANIYGKHSKYELLV